MTNITIILPVHEFGDVVGGYLKKAFTSIKSQKGLTTLPSIILVYTHFAEQNGLLDFIKEFTEPVEPTDPVLQINTVKNEGKTDFCSQINLGVKNTTTDYFSILEYDDEYSTIYFTNVLKHFKVFPDVSMFLPFTVEVDDKTGSLVQIVNQTIWSKGYVGENGVLGFLNTRSLNDYSFYTLGGAVIKKSDFDGVGGLKANIKLSFTYEFILRFLENGNKVYSIAKFGYKHTINRLGSLFSNFGVTMPMKERKFWFEVAKRESHFINDRYIDQSSLIEPVPEVSTESVA
jgi:hypothetical protein